MPTDRDRTQASASIEYFVAGCFGAAFAGAVGFAATYWLDLGIRYEGLSALVVLGALALGLGVWANTTLERAEVVEEREPLGSTREERRDVVEGFERGERRIERRRLLAGLAGGSLVAAALAALFPLRSLGPRPHGTLSRTAWRRGTRLVGDDGAPVRPGDLDVGTALTVYPEGVTDPAQRAAAQTVLIDLGAAAEATGTSGRRDWTVGHCIAYSRVCTHAGCPVGVYQPETHRLMCPCHQSLFDVVDGAKPIFGPASRPLPQLPLSLDGEGNLVAQGDFDEPVGPGFWNR
ncbi:MAG TPA: Rieske (2Fe-2S) protein [Acidimicrobiales bacterium]|nr:Rieske (2Fe-2S) protein [Acidimicrobiales bacterium]